MTPDQYEVAGCRLADAELFDPPTHEPHPRDRIEKAVNVCRRCPLIGPCLTEAVVDRSSGVRGGQLLDHGPSASSSAAGVMTAPKDELVRVIPEGSRRQSLVECPRCMTPVGLWIRVLPPGEYQRMHGTVDVTASLLPPEKRAAAMERAAEQAEKSVAVPWVMCVFCGYDDHYVIPAPSEIGGSA